MVLLLREDVEGYWKDLHNLETYVNRDYLDDAFLNLLKRLHSDTKLFSHSAISQSLFKILLKMAKKEKFKTLAFSLLRRPFGLSSSEDHIGFVKCSMALTNSLPYEHYSQIFYSFINRFKQDSSFLVISEEWNQLIQGLQIVSSLGIVLPQADLEISNASEENPYILGLIPTNYIELLVSLASWDDPLLTKLAQTNQQVFDCLFLTALIQYKTKGIVDDSLVILIKESFALFSHLLIEDLVKIDSSVKLIIGSFVSNHKLNLDL